MLSERKSARTEFAWRDCVKKPKKTPHACEKPGRAAGLCGECFSCSECLTQGGRPDTMSQSKRKAWDATMQASGHAPTRKTTKRASGDLSSNLRATASLFYDVELCTFTSPSRAPQQSPGNTNARFCVVAVSPGLTPSHGEEKLERLFANMCEQQGCTESLPFSLPPRSPPLAA